MALALSLLMACGSPSARGVRVDFFPGPIDRELQTASYDAVVRVLERHGARILRSKPGVYVHGFVGIECSSQRLTANLQYRRTDGEQSVAVRVCPAAFATPGGCPEDAPPETPAGHCREQIDDLLSSIERDLANHLLARTEVARFEGEPWWKSFSLASFLSLISLRRWIQPSRGDGWSSAGSATVVRGP